MGAHTAGRRLRGEVPFDVVELVQIGIWLGVDPRRFISAGEKAKAAS